MTWNSEIFGNFQAQIKDKSENLDEIQRIIHSEGSYDTLQADEKKAKLELENAIEIEECFWRDKLM